MFKIDVVSQSPSFSHPWIQGHQKSGSGTGFYIGGNRILTNAHVVANGKYITVQRDGDDRSMIAKPVYLGHDCDLAILEVEDVSVFEDAVPLRFTGLPKLRRVVAVIGYPRGGEQISITEGVVSRLSYRRYAHSGYHRHLLVQVDSAINPGNSGGPVVQGDRVVGVAFQAYTDAENTGYIIPSPVIRRFLKDIEDGRYDGHPEHGLIVLNGVMVNPAMRKFHKLKESDGGVKVGYVAGFAPTYGKIKKGDILLEIDGQPIGLDGKIDFRGERISFKVIFDLRQMGDVVDFKVSRQGQELNIPVKVTPSKPHHFMANIYAKFPRYDIFAGLVFSSLSRDYLKVWGKKWFRQAPIHLRYLHWYHLEIPRYKNSQELVVLSGRLPSGVNTHIGHFEEGVIDEVNGVKISSLEELRPALEQGGSDYIVIKLWKEPVPIVLPRKKAFEAHPEIIKQYGVYPERWLEPVAIFDRGNNG